jgi:hypothetical protein
VSPAKYELGFYIPEDDILHSHRCGNLKSYRFIIIYLIASQSSCVKGNLDETVKYYRPQRLVPARYRGHYSPCNLLGTTLSSVGNSVPCVDAFAITNARSL